MQFVLFSFSRSALDGPFSPQGAKGRFRSRPGSFKPTFYQLKTPSPLDVQIARGSCPHDTFGVSQRSTMRERYCKTFLCPSEMGFLARTVI